MQAPAPASLEPRIREIGGQLIAAARSQHDSFWAREKWEAALSRKLMQNQAFRIQALRFIDVLPVLSNATDLVDHLYEYFNVEDFPLPEAVRKGLTGFRTGLTDRLVAEGIRIAVRKLGRRFIGGSDAAEALRTTDELRKRNLNFTIDVLGEATVSAEEAVVYQEKYLQLLKDFAPVVRTWKPSDLLDTAHGRPSPRLNLSIKLTSLYSQASPVDPDGSAEAIKERLRPILRAARACDACICLDMEQYDYVEITLRVFKEIFIEPEFRDWSDVGIAMQAYLRDSEQHVAGICRWAQERGTPASVRLVRGAYWDFETVHARQNRWDVPVWTRKHETDWCYERCLRMLFDHYPAVETAVATHNVRSLAFAMAEAEARAMTSNQFEMQMLYGMADPLKDAVAQLGRRMRVYVPFGELIPGMSYLVRRLLENTASQSFLRMGFIENLPLDSLLASPVPPATAKDAPPAIRFLNEPLHRFTAEAERRRFAAAIARVRGQLGETYAPVINGKPVKPGSTIVSVNPARFSEVVGTVGAAGTDGAAEAVRAASRAFRDWRTTPAEKRAAILTKAAGFLRERRDEFAAWEIFEAGKTWTEADADVVEAVDFLVYYAAEAVRLARDQYFNVPGETNLYHYQPRGVCLVVPPWNFPLAILTGMLSAAIAAGNTAILKPASQTPVIGAQFMRILMEAGLPDGVVNFLPGQGSVIGDYLVQHPDIHCIAFTGSREVGCRINRLGAEVSSGQRHLKRIIAEMGGKNAVIIDSDADVDDAVRGTVVSAFGYQGQKCSAASRVVVVGDMYQTFVRRLVEASASLKIGLPEDPGNFMGPVIEEQAQRNILKAIENGKKTAKLALETDVSHLSHGYFVGPTIFTDVAPEDDLGQVEFFGPVVAVMHAKDLDEAFRIANGTSYALTGGMYSRSPAHLDAARNNFQVGNLYLNRKITGAIVGRQPFGGFKMSGVGSKAGGPDYLLQFLEPRTVTENTIRRGFAPEE